MSYHIVPRAGEQGPRPSAGNQAEVKIVDCWKTLPSADTRRHPRRGHPSQRPSSYIQPKPAERNKEKVDKRGVQTCHGSLLHGCE